jgi:hypothetical protein
MASTLQFLASIFIPYPYLALLPALVFGLLYINSKGKTVLITGILWLFYAVYEELHLLRIACSGECNIRIDLFLIYPILFALSIIALFIAIRNSLKN